MLTPKERALEAINHREPNRVPVEYRAKPEVTQLLLRHYQLQTQEELLDQFGVDFRYVEPVYHLVDNDHLYRGPERPHYPDGSWDDIWGVRRRKVEYQTALGSGTYNELVSYPLRDACTVAEVDTYPWPDPGWYDFSGVAAECDLYPDYAIVGGVHALPFGDAWRMQGMDIFFMNMIAAPAVVEAIFRHVEEFYREINVRFFEAAQGKVTVFYMGSDLGTQERLLISPQMFRRFVKPILARLTEQGHSYGAKVMYHTCGAVRDIIPDFIDIGIDILDPVQSAAAGMDLKELKQEFGNDICFHGGISTQTILPFGTPEQVRDEVWRTLDIMMPSGGYILQSDQYLQLDVPVENIVAMYEAVREYGVYR